MIYLIIFFVSLQTGEIGNYEESFATVEGCRVARRLITADLKEKGNDITTADCVSHNR